MKNIFRRQNIVLLHSIVACFFLPMAILFSVTGIYLALNLPSSHVTSIFETQLPSSAPSDNQAESLARSELQKHSLPTPTGTPSVKSGAKGGWQLSWNGTATSMSIKTAKDGSAEISVDQNLMLKRLEQLHKNKGAFAFKLISVAWAMALLLLIVSGSVLAFQVKALKRVALISTALGIAVFLALAWLS